MGDVGRPPLAVTFHAVIKRLRFCPVMGDPDARREFDGS